MNTYNNFSSPGHIFTHEDIPIATRRAIRELRSLSNSEGLKSVISVLFLYFIGGCTLYFFHNIFIVIPATLITSIAMMRGAFLLHDASHKTLFRTSSANRIAGILCGAPLGISVSLYWHVHQQHHRYVRSDKDPGNLEEAARRLHVRKSLLYIFMVFAGSIVYISQSAISLPWYVIRHKRFDVLQEYLCSAIIFSLLAYFFTPSDFIRVWLYPFLITEVLMNIRNFAEHEMTGSPHSTFTSTRTVLSTPFIQWLMHNENYHIEHHLFPDVPFHQLPKLHSMLEPTFAAAGSPVSKGYGSFYKEVLVRMAKAIKDAGKKGNFGHQ